MQELIKINSDPPERIARLYGIGPAIARKIAEYRAAHGPFRSPEDLAKVDGVKLELAHLLAQQIDWQVQEPEQAGRSPIQWEVLLLFFPILLPIFYYGVRNLSYLITVLRNLRWYSSNYPGYWVDIWIDISATALFIGAIALIIGVVIGALGSEKTEQSFNRKLRWIMLYIVICMGFLGLGNLFYYSLYVPGRWNALLANRDAMLGLLMGFFLLPMTMPVILLILKPNLRLPKAYIRSVDLIIAAGTVLN